MTKQQLEQDTERYYNEVVKAITIMEENRINYDERASEYVEAVKKNNPEPTWDLVHTAYITGSLDADVKNTEYADWKTRLADEQKLLKKKLLKLVEFINSERFFELSENNRKLLQSQKIAMELYLSILDIRMFEDVDNAVIPDYSTLSAFAGMFSKPIVSNH